MNDPSTRRRGFAAVKHVARLLILALVVWGIWRTVSDAAAEIRAEGLALSELNYGWLLASAAFYAAGLAPMWLFWHMTMVAMGQRPTRRESLRAYTVGHLGKYVPGKAMVVVLRTGLVRGERVDTAVAAVSVFVETLTMMAVGASLAAVLLAIGSDQWKLVVLAVVLMFCAGLPTAPPFFRRLVRMMQVRRLSPAVDAAIDHLNTRLIATGWLIMALGWSVLGLSLWATLQALPMGPPAAASLADWPVITGCVALAMVAGFLSLLPGGILVREYIVMSLISPLYGNVTAILSAVVLRLVWLMAELALSGILYPGARQVLQANQEQCVAAAGEESSDNVSGSN